MPVSTTTPIVATNTTEIDTWRIAGVFIGLPNSGMGNTIDLIISAGKAQPDGSVIWIADDHYRIENEYDDAGSPIASAQHFDDVAARITAGGLSIYAELRDICYAYAQERGWIPAGAV